MDLKPFVLWLLNIHIMATFSAVLSKETRQNLSIMAELEIIGENLIYKVVVLGTPILNLVPRNPCFAKHVTTEIHSRQNF